MAKEVARHLVMAGRLFDEDPELAWQHAMAARGRGARIAVVREAAGLACYQTQRFAEALAELRTARRLTGSHEHLPVMADCERGLGRPERALAMATSPEAATLDQAGRIEMRIVAAGARQDLGQAEAAVVTLQVPELDSRTNAPWLARLQSAYADALYAVGRDQEGRQWLERAAASDDTGQTHAAHRLLELDGFAVEDALDDDADVDDDVDDESQTSVDEGEPEAHDR